MLLENNFSASLESFEEALDDHKTSKEDLMQKMLELDQLVCALSVPIKSFQILSQPAREYLIDSISLLVDLYPESLSRMSEYALEFKAKHFRSTAWQAVWEKVLLTTERAEAFAKLTLEDEELDSKQPLQAFDFYAGFQT